jgi:serine/threonine protein kinase/tetratricopeptide (TPR) repeat protein
MANDPLIGSTVGGCMILEVIGQGGMGVIYKARQKSLDRIVALKVLAPHLANDANFVGRFQREARAIARVNHPNILAVYDVGDDQNVNYMIMELIDGQSLAELQTDRHGALPFDDACNFIKQAAQGLEAAQASGIIHRDIKPENLMVTKKNIIKVSDFGLAKDADSTTTSTDAVMGTPAFMSPEQCDGKKVDGRSDIYSLGGTFYRLITGRLPFEAETAMSMMYRHKHEALIPPHEVVPSLPAPISTIVVKMMAKKREQRYQTMTEVIDAIDQAKQQPASAGPSRLPQVQAAAPVSIPPESPSGLEPFGDLPPPPMGLLNQDDSHASGRRPMPAGLVPPGASARRTAVSNRMPAASAPPGGFGGPDDSSRMSMPSGVMGAGLGAGLAVPDDAYAAIGAGDEALARGDRVNAIKAYRKALQSRSLDNATRGRVDAEVRKEVSSRRQAADNFLKRSMLVEASREYRVLADIDPADENAKANLKDVEGKLAQKRTVQNDIRTAVASSQFEKAIKLWDATPTELRDDAMAKQIETLRTVNVPALKLAEQGESFAKQGRLEESIATFQDALKINQACEPARIGLKEAETKFQRIEFMLKEGYQYSLEQNYAKAIETWKPILVIRPGHPQTVKSMIDAYIAHAQYLRSQGNLEGALNAYKGAAEADPQNRTVRKTLEDLTNLYDKESALIDRANDAAARNNLSAAIKYWKDIQKVNPANKKAGQQVAQLGKMRSGGRVKLLVGLVVMAVVGLGGYQFYTEKMLLGKIQEHKSKGEWGEVEKDIGDTRYFILKQDIEKIRQDAALHLRVDNAIRLASRVELDDLKILSTDDPDAERRKMAFQVRRAILDDELRTRDKKVEAALQEGLKAGDAGDIITAKAKFPNAHDVLLEIRDIVAETKDPPPEIAQQGLLAEQKAGVLDNLSKALSNMALKSTAQKNLQNAQKDVAVFKNPTLETYISKLLAGLGLNEATGTKSLEAALKALAAVEPSGRHTQLKDAEKNLKEVMLNAGNTEQARQMLRYVEDLKFCEQNNDESDRNMRMIHTVDPLTAQGPTWWGEEAHKRAFCIDRFEYSKDGVPVAGVTYLEAVKKCRDDKKELCSAIEWVDACKGGAKHAEQYPYSNEYIADNCNTENKAGAVKPGAKPKCHNTVGVYDMSGNLAEWVADPNANPNSAIIRGGSYKSGERDSSCLSEEERPASDRKSDVGFRCCQPLPNK